MSKQSIAWSFVVALACLVGACESNTTASSSVEAVQQAIDRCREDLEQCDASVQVCQVEALGCVLSVSGLGVMPDDVAGECEQLRDGKPCTLSMIYTGEDCDAVHEACLESARGEGSDDSDSDGAGDSNSDSDCDYNGDSDGNSDSDSDSDADTDSDVCGYAV